MVFTVTFGEALKEARTGKFTQKQLALAIGVTQSMIGQVESGLRESLSADRVTRIEEVLDLKKGSLVKHLPAGHRAHDLQGTEYPDYGLVWGGPLDRDVPEPEQGQTFRLAGRYPAGTFILKVQGHSIEGYHICDGDYIAVRPAQEPEIGAMNIIRQGNAYTLKHYDGQRFYEFRTGGSPQPIETNGPVEVVGVMICIVEGERRITPKPKIKAGEPKGKGKGKK